MFNESAEKRFLDLFGSYSSDTDAKKTNYISFLKKNKARNRERIDGVEDNFV